MKKGNSHLGLLIAAAVFVGLAVSYGIHWASLPGPPSSDPIINPPASYAAAPFFTPKAKQKISYAHAGARKDISDWGPGANSPFNNYPVRILKVHAPISDITLRVTDASPIYNNTCKGVEFYLQNNSRNEQPFNAEDGRLEIVQQALDPHGQWQHIEIFRNSDCGNSLHTLYLPRTHAWRFIAPRYAGSYKTKLRFVLVRRQEGQPTATIISNEFDGSIDPGLFSTIEELIVSRFSAFG